MGWNKFRDFGNKEYNTILLKKRSVSYVFFRLLVILILVRSDSGVLRLVGRIAEEIAVKHGVDLSLFSMKFVDFSKRTLAIFEVFEFDGFQNKWMKVASFKVEKMQSSFVKVFKVFVENNDSKFQRQFSIKRNQK